MNEIDQLKERICEAGIKGVRTSEIREDYEPVGGLMIRDLVDSGEYETKRVPVTSLSSEWRIRRIGVKEAKEMLKEFKRNYPEISVFDKSFVYVAEKAIKIEE